MESINGSPIGNKTQNTRTTLLKNVSIRNIVEFIPDYKLMVLEEESIQQSRMRPKTAMNYDRWGEETLICNICDFI